MRIIAGSARGKKLAAFASHHIRPTSDRVREALFSILTSRYDGSLADLTVLDLFAGTGALALEALSRGAKSAVLIEGSRQSLAIIRANITACRFEDRTVLIQGELPATLRSAALHGPFDLIFLDPPYGQGLAPVILQQIGEQGLLNDAGIVVVEAGVKESLPTEAGGLELRDRRSYGATAISLFERIKRSA